MQTYNLNGRAGGKRQFEFTADELTILHNALSEYRERSKDRGLSSQASDAEELRSALMYKQQTVDRRGLRYSPA